MAEIGPTAGPGTTVRRFALISPAVWVAVLGGLAALSLVATLPLSLLARQFGNGIVAVVIGIPCAGVGVLVARRQPGNALGWIFLVIAVCLFLATDGGDYASLVYRHGYRLPLGAVGLACDGLWSAGLALFLVVILLFPDGTLSSGFWRWALRAYGALYAALLVALGVATAAALAAHPVRVDATGGLAADLSILVDVSVDVAAARLPWTTRRVRSRRSTTCSCSRCWPPGLASSATRC